MTGYVIAQSGLNVRTGPGTEYPMVAILPYGAYVEVLSVTGDWYQIADGYVFAQWVRQDRNFDAAIEFVLKWEGGLSTDKQDPGNWTGGIVGRGEFKGTKYGISAYAYPDLDIANLTLDQAKSIYYRDYWQKSGADKLESDLSLVVLDTAVNIGVGRARNLLQQSKEQIATYLGLRLDLYTHFAGWERYGAAWVRRVADLLREINGLGQ